MPRMTVDVVIVGCGPVGALAANLCAAQGLSVLALEREAHPYPLPRAVHIDHEMMRLFQTAGIIEAVRGDVSESDGHVHLGADGDVIRYLGTAGKPRPFGWASDYFFYQPELEEHLRQALGRRANATLRLGADVTGVEQAGDGVRVAYRADGGDHRVEARWAIACDGANSTIRKALGIRLDDLAFEEPWLVVDVEVDGPLRFDPIGGLPANADLQRLSVMNCDPARPSTIVPGRGNHRRWEFMLLPGEDDRAMMRPAAVAGLIAPWVAGVPHRIIRAATYRFHGLMAAEWRRGPVFLAGDAAHQTPPFFGQGMCHGMRDVANLSWKMGAISRREASPALLDSYQSERDSHVRAVIDAAVEAGRYICILDPAKAAARDAELRRRTDRVETAGDLIPAIADGAVLANGGERFIQPRLGDGRLLDDAIGGGWRLFHAGGEMVAAPADIAAIDAVELNDGGAVAALLARHGTGAMLVRPDHYIFGYGSAAALLAARARLLAPRPEGRTIERNADRRATDRLAVGRER
jgi:3-(3-hydroxy-phenyl)propionate hydroxylase